MKLIFIALMLLEVYHCEGDEVGGLVIHDGTKFKADVIQYIVKTVTNMTLETLSRAEPQTKLQAYNAIRDALLKSSKFLGTNGDSFVNFLMLGIQLLTKSSKDEIIRIPKLFINLLESNINGKNDLSESKVMIQSNDETTIKTILPIERNPYIINNTFNNSFQNTTNVKNNTEDIFNRIFNEQSYGENRMQDFKPITEMLIKKYFDKYSNSKDKIRSLQDLINKVQTVVDKHPSNKNYKAILDELEHTLQNTIEYEAYSESRRTIMALVPSNSKDNMGNANNKTKVNETSMANPYLKSVIKDYANENSKKYTLNRVDIKHSDEIDACGCECLIERTCTNIQSLKTLTCKFDQSVHPLESLCNHVAECSDQTDEISCLKQVIDKLRSANKIISHVENDLNPRNCFKNQMTNILLPSRTQALKHIVEAQLKFLNTFENTDISDMKPEVKNMVNQVTYVITTASQGLEEALCTTELAKVKEQSEMFRSFGDLVAKMDNELDEVIFSPSKCICEKQDCISRDCNEGCKNLCWRKYLLGRWQCESVQDMPSIPFNKICDGTRDCKDQTDEKDCFSGSSKYDANNMFASVLKNLVLKMKSPENIYVSVKSKVYALIISIKELQNTTMRVIPNTELIKKQRDSIVYSVVNIYSDMVNNMRHLNQDFEPYQFFQKVITGIIEALKLSHAGNKINKVMELNDCLCKDDRCVFTQCSTTCAQMCTMESRILNYTCQGPVTVLIPAVNICNGEKDCSYGEDESDCNKGLCSPHHLTTLWKKLEFLIENEKGTFLYDSIKNWYEKILNDLKTKEWMESTHIIIGTVVEEILHDLLMTYGSYPPKRASSKRVETTFANVANEVKKLLKSCK